MIRSFLTELNTLGSSVFSKERSPGFALGPCSPNRLSTRLPTPVIVLIETILTPQPPSPLYKLPAIIIQACGVGEGEGDGEGEGPGLGEGDGCGVGVGVTAAQVTPFGKVSFVPSNSMSVSPRPGFRNRRTIFIMLIVTL